MSNSLHLDGFNVLCGSLVGQGQYRDVFTMRFDADKVVKIEREPSQRWCNVLEYALWRQWRDTTAVARWLAPCHHLSECGHILIMDRTTAPMSDARTLPARMPAFLTDLKPANFGYIGKRLVCHDYAFTVPELKTKPRRIKWRT